MPLYLRRIKSSVLNPDTVGSETSSRIRIMIRKKSYQIRTAPDPKWFEENYPENKIWPFPNKNAQFKNINSFFFKNP